MINQEQGGCEEQPRTHTFNPNEHLIQLKSKDGPKDYLPVMWRLVWFRDHCPHGTIETEMLHLDLDRVTEEETYVWSNEKRRSEKVVKQANGFVIFKATVKDGNGGIGTGTKSEKAASFPDFIEKAETGAIGRALAALGYGTQFAPELSEEHRIVDSPVDRQAVASNGQATVASGNSQPTTITEQQISSICKLNELMGKEDSEGLDTLSYIDAKKLINRLTAEYRGYKQNPEKVLDELKREAVNCGFVIGTTNDQRKLSWSAQLNKVFDGNSPIEANLMQVSNLARINGAIEAHKRATTNRGAAHTHLP